MFIEFLYPKRWLLLLSLSIAFFSTTALSSDCNLSLRKRIIEGKDPLKVTSEGDAILLNKRDALDRYVDLLKKHSSEDWNAFISSIDDQIRERFHGVIPGEWAPTIDPNLLTKKSASLQAKIYFEPGERSLELEVSTPYLLCSSPHYCFAHELFHYYIQSHHYANWDFYRELMDWVHSGNVKGTRSYQSLADFDRDNPTSSNNDQKLVFGGKTWLEIKLWLYTYRVYEEILADVMPTTMFNGTGSEIAKGQAEALAIEKLLGDDYLARDMNHEITTPEILLPIVHHDEPQLDYPHRLGSLARQEIWSTVKHYKNNLRPSELFNLLDKTMREELSLQWRAGSPFISNSPRDLSVNVINRVNESFSDLFNHKVQNFVHRGPQHNRRGRRNRQTPVIE